MALQLKFFGGWEARLGETPLTCGRLAARLLALLALRAPREVERAWLAETLWPDAEESRARFYLRRTLLELRETLGECLIAEGSRLRLSCHSDLQDFDDALRRHDGNTAATLHVGVFLAGWSDEWVLTERTRCELALQALLETRAPQLDTERHDSLPLPLTPLRGRDHDLQRVLALLQQSRLVTLTGAGGVGKTRLAQELGLASVAHFRNGAVFVDLSALQPGARLGDTLAQALGLRFGGSGGQEVALHWLLQKKLLLVIDNCEQLISEAALLVRTLLTKTREVHLLVTSREPLGIPSESLWRVPSLPTEAAEALFLERAQDAVPQWQPTASEHAAIAAICRRLDGIPLAIELAATQIAVLPATELAQRLEGSFLSLLGEDLSAPPRHRTLEAAIQWGVNLLTDSERLLFARLAVFSGGWSLAAAEAVCGDALLEIKQVAPLLARLVGRSLVVLTEGRYRFLEPLRAFASTLKQANDPHLEQRHAAYFCSFVNHHLKALRTHGEAMALETLAQEQANLEVALSRPTCPEVGVCLGLGLGRYLRRRGYATAAVSPLEQALMAAPGSLEVLCEQAGLLLDLAKPQQARLSAQKALDLATDPRAQAEALNLLGQAAEQERDFEEARTHFESAQALYASVGERAATARMQNNLGYLAFLDPTLDRVAAEEALREAMITLQETGDQHAISSALNNLGNLAFLREDWRAAEVAYTQSQELEETLGNPLGVARALSNLGEVAQQQGKRERAEALYAEAEHRFRELGSPLADYTAQLREQLG